MVTLLINRGLLLTLLACFVILCSSQASFAQTEERTPAAAERPIDVDVEIQLHLLIASNTAEGGKLPPRLEVVAKELRPVLPFSNYRPGASILGRVKNARPWSVKGVGRNLFVTPALESSVLPTFYEVSAGLVTLKSDSASRTAVQFGSFRFGLRIPLQMASPQARESGERPSSVSYEQVGITTDVTIREGEAIVVGTLDTGRPNETLVLVLVANRASSR